MNVPVEIQAKVTAKIQQGLDYAKKAYGVDFPFPKVTYNIRGATAGRACFSTWHIELNPTLLLENGDGFIDRTPNHELAHLIARKQYGANGGGHGHHWKYVMTHVMRQPAERCHSFDITTIRQNQGGVAYDCDCHTRMVTARKHQNIQKAMARGGYYRCRTCKGTLRLSAKNQAPVAQPKPAPVKAQSKPATGGASKIDRARSLYRQARRFGHTRAQVIKMFVEQIGLTPAGANTYFSNLAKEIGSL